MSEVKETDTSSTSSCASCGIAEVDDIKLKNCDDCDLVRYCSDTCQKDHKSEHDEACKIRAAELRDELLFKQPEGTYPGDCPICMIPLMLAPSKSTMLSCCSKIVCIGCAYAHANKRRELGAKLVQSCPFCRELASKIVEESEKLRMKRINANDPAAMICQGKIEYEKGDYDAAFEWFSKAAELGDVDAHFRLSQFYQHGLGVGKDRGMDRGKEVYHMEEATIGGHPGARHNLGCYELKDMGNTERAVKHFLIAAAQGLDLSITVLMGLFKQGFVSKEDLTIALRAHHAAVEATKSPQREAATTMYLHNS